MEISVHFFAHFNVLKHGFNLHYCHLSPFSLGNLYLENNTLFYLHLVIHCFFSFIRNCSVIKKTRTQLFSVDLKESVSGVQQENKTLRVIEFLFDFVFCIPFHAFMFLVKDFVFKTTFLKLIIKIRS